jgi:hypothetical protein
MKENPNKTKKRMGFKKKMAPTKFLFWFLGFGAY